MIISWFLFVDGKRAWSAKPFLFGDPSYGNCSPRDFLEISFRGCLKSSLKIVF